MPVGSFAPSMLVEPMAQVTMLVIRRLLPRLSLTPFASAKHFHAKNAEGEASNKYANLQSKYTGNLAKIKTLKRRMDAWDMISPFVIPDFVDPYALSVENCWGDRKLTGVRIGVSLP